LQIRVARIFNTYGPRMLPNDGRVISNFIIRALRGEPLTIYGKGSQTRSFCYVDDLIDGLYRLMNAPDEVTGPINLGNPSELSIGKLAERVIRIAGSSSQVEYGPLPADDPMQRQPDIALAKKLLDWSPTVDLDDGLRRTIAYFRDLVGPGR
jgi:UDP-glucuronate decarboxylase